MDNKTIHLKCWIDLDGQKFFGPGPVRLLELIAQEGSISAAAKKMGMSYCKAFDIINRLNTNTQNQLVISYKGGSNKGGTQLTEAGNKLIWEYKELMGKLNNIVENETDILKLI